VKNLPSFFFIAALFITGFTSCKKINEATDLGDELIPVVDNVNTFEVALNTITDNRLYNDTTKVGYGDYVAAGDITDPEFGQTHANFYFNILPSSLGVNPFINKDTARVIDSVVLSLAYQGAYGDTSSGTQTLRVFEIDPNIPFRADTPLYKYADPTTEFATAGSELGSKTFSINSLDDTIKIIRKDTAKVANVVRIKLQNSLGERFAQYDVTNGPLGGYYNDTTRGVIPGANFRKLFKGLAIKSDNSGNVLTYFSLVNTAKTKLTIYYKIVHGNGIIDTLSTDFYHSTSGQSNFIKRTPGGNWSNYLNNGLSSDDKIYLQSSPSGSYASVLIPELATLGNKVVHKAELIVTKISSPLEDKFFPPAQLFLDRTNSETPDTSFLLYRDLAPLQDGSLDFNTFGGFLKSGEYRFNITRFVQGVLTRHEPIDTLRLYAPFRTTNFAPAFSGNASFEVLDRIAGGRVVLAGGNYLANPGQRLKLRIIYSNL